MSSVMDGILVGLQQWLAGSELQGLGELFKGAFSAVSLPIEGLSAYFDWLVGFAEKLCPWIGFSVSDYDQFHDWLVANGGWRDLTDVARFMFDPFLDFYFCGLCIRCLIAAWITALFLRLALWVYGMVPLFHGDAG